MKSLLNIAPGTMPTQDKRKASQERAVQLKAEHIALVRHLGNIQHQVTAQFERLRQRADAADAEAMRLRAELLIIRTAVYWNLGQAVPQRSATAPARARVPLPRQSQAAQQVICQTGCAGHAHPWLEADGNCSRTGDACHVTAASSTPESHHSE
ncbi:hypothetical protein [Hydrogenophaga sp. 5NK40-0174]|uniref:hypothetical protein n=1 Tax=Hydrogenophaga sp. 5NK40-0174 TaxID=3127649 RepID=UPI0031065FD1